MVNVQAARLLAAELRAALRPLKIGDTIPDSPRWREVLVSLEFWWPSVLHWRSESLDGFDLVEAKKCGPLEVCFRGLALLISDQTWTPCAARIAVDAEGRRVEAYWLALGQPGNGALGLDRSAKYGSDAARALRSEVVAGPVAHAWVFDVSSKALP